jgi:hypothetical protein
MLEEYVVSEESTMVLSRSRHDDAHKPGLFCWWLGQVIRTCLRLIPRFGYDKIRTPDKGQVTYQVMFFVSVWPLVIAEPVMQDS